MRLPAADTEAAPPSRTSMQSVRTLGIVAPMASLRLPRELSQKSLNMDMSKAWSDAASLAVGDASKQAALSRLMTFDNPQGSRALDLDTMVSCWVHVCSLIVLKWVSSSVLDRHNSC